MGRPKAEVRKIRVMAIQNPSGKEITTQTTKSDGESIEMTFKQDETDENIRDAIVETLREKYPEMRGSATLHVATKGKKLKEIEHVMENIGKSNLYVVWNGTFSKPPGLPVNVDDGTMQFLGEKETSSLEPVCQNPPVSNCAPATLLGDLFSQASDHLIHMKTLIPNHKDTLDLHVARLEAAKVTPLFPELANAIIDVSTNALCVCTKFHCGLLTEADFIRASMDWQGALQNHFVTTTTVKEEPDFTKLSSVEANLGNMVLTDADRQHGEAMDLDEGTEVVKKENNLPDWDSLMGQGAVVMEQTTAMGVTDGLQGIDLVDMDFLNNLGIDPILLPPESTVDFGSDLKADGGVPDKMFA